VDPGKRSGRIPGTERGWRGLAAAALRWQSVLMRAPLLAALLLRVAGLLMVVFGLVRLVAGVVGSWGRIDLIYWETFLRTVVLPPALWVFAGLLLGLLARRVGRWIGRGLEGNSPEA